MRKQLSKINNVRTGFTGVFVRFGTKSNWHGFPEKTVLLKDIKLNGKEYADHLWFNYTKEFQKIDLQENDVVCFDARVKRYIKGYKGYREEMQYEHPIEEDYKLSHPTKVKKVINNG